MSAELVDPFAAPKPEPLLTADEWVAIRDEINERKFDDHALYPELVAEALRTLGEIGSGTATNPARTATQSLREMVYRARNGAWRSEIEAEPAWSLDTSTREPLIDQDLWPDREPFIRKVETVVEDL